MVICWQLYLSTHTGSLKLVLMLKYFSFRETKKSHAAPPRGQINMYFFKCFVTMWCSGVSYLPYWMGVISSSVVYFLMNVSLLISMSISLVRTLLVVKVVTTHNFQGLYFKMTYDPPPFPNWMIGVRLHNMALNILMMCFLRIWYY